MDIDLNNNLVYLRLIGPPGGWFAFGFGNNMMPGTYAIIIDENGNPFQYILGQYFMEPWILIDPIINLNILSTTIITLCVVTRREILLSRSINTNSDEYPFAYNFTTDMNDIQIIWAHGSR